MIFTFGSKENGRNKEVVAGLSQGEVLLFIFSGSVLVKFCYVNLKNPKNIVQVPSQKAGKGFWGTSYRILLLIQNAVLSALGNELTLRMRSIGKSGFRF